RPDRAGRAGPRRSAALGAPAPQAKEDTPHARSRDTTSTTTDASRTARAAGRALTGLELAGIAGLTCMIAIHATELAGKTDEVAYLGFGYLALIVTSVLTIVMIATRDRRGG